MREALLRAEHEVRVLVVEAVDKGRAEDDDRRADQDVDGLGEAVRPVTAVELQEESRNQAEDRRFTDVQPTPVGSRVAAVTSDRFAPR